MAPDLESAVPPTVLHIAQTSEWESARGSGAYRGSTRGQSYDEVGFVHCCTAEQVPDVLARHFAGSGDGLLLLEVDCAALARRGTDVTWHPVGTERFPHVGGPLPVDACSVIERLPFAGRGRRVVDVVRFWRDARLAGAVPDAPYESWAFGDSPALADALLELVLTGPKRATAGLVADFGRDGDPLPRVGGFSVVLDGSARPRCVVRTEEVQIGPLDSVDESFAWDEGEGDRTRADWLDGHRRYFTRTCAEAGIPYDDSMPTVFERFSLVWAP